MPVTQRGIILLLALTPLTGGCEETTEQEPEGSATLGVLLPLTGPLADVGSLAERAMQVALEEVNQGGGVRGKPLRVEVRDSQTDAERTVGLAVELIEEEGIEVIMAGIASSVAEAVLEETVPRDAVVLTGLSGLHTLANEARAGRFFRTLPVREMDDEWVTWFTMRFLAEGHRRIRFIHNDVDIYAHLIGVLQDHLQEACDDCELTLHSYPEEFEDSDLLATTADLTQEPPDLIVLMGFEPDVLEILKQTESADYDGSYFLNDLFGSVGPHFVQLLQPDTVRRLRWADMATGEVGEEYGERFKALHGEASALGRGELSTYDAVMTAALAMNAATSLQGPDVAQALFDLANAPGEQVHPFDYAQALELQEESQELDYEGFALTDFSSIGENENLPQPAFFGWNGSGEVVPWTAP